MSLSCLVYVSVATHEMQDDELKTLLKYARIKNEKLGVSGLLLYRDGLFIQALEGEKDAVEGLFSRILKDTRHKNITKIYEKPVEHRSFPDWTMGFARMGDSELEKLEGFSEFLKSPSAGFFTRTPSYAQALLDNFKADLLF